MPKQPPILLWFSPRLTKLRTLRWHYDTLALINVNKKKKVQHEGFVTPTLCNLCVRGLKETDSELQKLLESCQSPFREKPEDLLNYEMM